MDTLSSADAVKAARQTFAALARLLNSVGFGEFRLEFVRQVNLLVAHLISRRLFDSARALR